MIQLDTLRRWQDEGKEVIAVHYASESILTAQAAPPGIASIAVHNLRESRTIAFSRTDIATDASDLDREMSVLQRFYEYVASHKDAIFVHWNMNRAQFGFDTLQKRYRYLRSSGPRLAVSIPTLRFSIFSPKQPRTDDKDISVSKPHNDVALDDLLESTFGQNYAPHPQLENTAHLNSVATYSFVTGQVEAELFEKQDWHQITASTSAKAKIVATLYMRLMESQIRTANSAGVVAFAGKSIDAVEAVMAIADRYSDMLVKLRKRHDKRPALQPADEYDDQYLFGALLALFFDDIRAEQYTPSYANSSSRLDFLLHEFGLGIELKHTRDSAKTPDVANELIVDKERYAAYKGITHLVAIVFDLDRRIENPTALERDLAVKNSEKGLTVTIKIVDR